MRKKIAVLLGQPEEIYQNSFLQGFVKEAFAADHDVCIFSMYLKHQSTKGREKGDSAIFSLVEYDLFDAIVILANTIQTPGVLRHLEEDLHERYDKTVIFVDQESKYFPTVAADNSLTIKKLISHLIEEHGYKDIAFLTGNEFHPHAKARLQSFLNCMQEYGLEVPENRIFYGDFWYNSGKTTAEKLLLDREHLPEAVACANDYMALGLISALEKEGVRVPDDIAVTGYDASLAGRRASVPITSIPIPAQEIGSYCMNYAMALSEGKPISEFASQADLFIGKSCGCDREVTDYVDESENWEKDKPTNFEAVLGAMEDSMLMQTENNGLLNTLFFYVNQIRPFEEFHLCLNAGWAAEEFGSEIDTGYTEKMVDALKCGRAGMGEDRVDLAAIFDKKILLPELAEDHEKPRAYYFTSLFFEEHCFGYAAINYGEMLHCYGEAYRRWTNAVMRGMESFMRVRILQAKNAVLETEQIRDALTGLYNYRGFMQYTAAALKETQDADRSVDIAVIELCGLHEIYKNIRSSDGDRVIKEFAQILIQIGAQEELCYLGNGEFLIGRIRQDDADDNFKSLMESLRQKLEQYCQSNGLDGKLTIAFGDVQGTADGEEKLGNLIGEAVGRKNADKIREQRRGQEGTEEAASPKAELVAQILDRNQLVYFFQPIVDAGTGEIFAYEALMRANTEEKISPLDILKCAEYLGRLKDVERATFFNVLSYVEGHSELFEGKKIFINSIPGVQMDEKDLDVIRKKLMAMDGKIVVELTEQAELGDEELETLKKGYERLGVDTAVDDYGTGYSNVYNLLRYMPNVVKIDRMLLANIQMSAQKQHFVKEIIEFSHNNGITVLAEGVETTEELKMVISLGTDLIQGYYTARPSAEVLRKIDAGIRNEIIQYGQYAQEKNKRKVFQAGQDVSISLIQLATGHYSKIRFSTDDAPHRDVEIVGLQGFQANIEIEFEDSYEGRIELRDVDLAVHNEQPTIRLGENCDITLVLVGDNILEQGGILVPESSKLTLQGDGNLRIPQIAVRGYGIGNGKDSRCGELYFEQDGRIEIGGNTVHGVGIGAGMGGDIHINRGDYCIQIAGEEAVGIGSFYADMSLTIQSCALDMTVKGNTSVGIGSIRGNVDVDISYANVKCLFNANRCIGIGTLEGSSTKFNLREGVVEINGRSECLCGIGSEDGEVDVAMAKFGVSIYAEGREAIGMGNRSKTAQIHTQNGDVVVHVKNQLDYDIGAKTFEMINGYSEFRLNNQKIVREIIKGDM